MMMLRSNLEFNARAAQVARALDARTRATRGAYFMRRWMSC